MGFHRCLSSALLFLGLAFLSHGDGRREWGNSVAIIAALTALGVYDMLQINHAILRNYPVLGHMRYLFEMIRPEIRQYLLEDDHVEVPFSREDRNIVYQRAKNVEDKRPFGTRQRVYD